MSEYVECKTKIKDRKALVEALMAMGWTKDQIEVHDEAVNMYGYQSDKRQQKAHVIIRRKNVGGASNDLGFVRGEDGTYTAIISDYDMHANIGQARHTGGYNDKWLKDLTQKYTEKLYTRVAKQKGFEVKREVKGKQVILSLWK